jgi:hypothetical protein
MVGYGNQVNDRVCSEYNDNVCWFDVDNNNNKVNEGKHDDVFQPNTDKDHAKKLTTSRGDFISLSLSLTSRVAMFNQRDDLHNIQRVN